MSYQSEHYEPSVPHGHGHEVERYNPADTEATSQSPVNEQLFLSQPGEPTKKEVEKGPELIVITGMSGAGRSEAMHTFEDLDYFCIDNLPPSLLKHLVNLAELPGGKRRKLAIVCDIRSQEFFSHLQDELRQLTERGMTHSLLFLDAQDEVLLRRFKASRRRHPMCDDGMTIIAGIHRERKALESTKHLADAVIDTSTLRPQELRIKIREIFSEQTAKQSLSISVSSFGFKHASPSDADIVMDVRFLPNPYWEESLRGLTGLDEAVRLYVLDKTETTAFLARWYDLLDVIIPGYVNEGKSHLSILIGCTGGQHRSVVLTEKTAEYLRKNGYRASSSHRDIELRESAV